MGRHKVQNTPAIRRMPTYLHKLTQMSLAGEEYTSTSLLAEYISLDPIIVRKDIELTKLKGFPGVGYKTDELIKAIRQYLGWLSPKKAWMIGAGSLGTALLGYEEFAEFSLEYTAVVDSDPAKIGEIVHGHRIMSFDELSEAVKTNKPDLAVICVSSSAAQQVVDQLIRLGVKSFWNFANICLQVPPDVLVQREVIAGGFALLSMKMKKHVKSLEV